MSTIGTHDGTFHCDEALACYMLTKTSQFSSAKIVRTRDSNQLETFDIVVDVGAVYEPARHRYDHHQRGFMETLDSQHTMKLSSAGLIYKHFGREVIRNISNVQEKDIELVYQKVYTNFIEALDGIDNGIAQYPSDIKPLYKNNTDLSSRVGNLNPSWNESGVNIDERFQRAMALTGAEFTDAVNFVVNSWLPARQIVERAMAERYTVHPSGQVVLFKDYTIWKSHLLELEEEMKIEKPILYVLYEDTSKKWRIQCVPEGENSFESRKPLPEAWRGLRDEQLSTLNGIPGSIFIHASGFIGGHNTYEGVLRMSQLAMDEPAPAKKQKTTL